ncbi:MAG: VC1465 family Xer recombination activation factor [Gallionella sp.]|nr:VC1465 family Xer recombination activation factor [Gallionella sp.]
MSRRKGSCRWVEPQDFRDLRRQAGLTRLQAAKALDVTGRTIQNWETGGARIPWMAHRMLRILRGYALPGKAWESWTIDVDTLTAPNGWHFTANELQHMPT